VEGNGGAGRLSSLVSLRKMQLSCLKANYHSDLEVKKEIEQELDELTKLMQPLLHSFMTIMEDEEDVQSYTAIRRLYLPPIILAYNSARTWAATYLGPETLLPCLELATILAADENSELADDFEATGLMQGFIKAMAHSSKILIRLNQEREMAVREDSKTAAGKKRRKKESKKSRFWMGETTDVWDPTKIV
jgi:Nuclear pore protein 84 / 107